MKTQVRTVLEKYKANGGQYQEVHLADCGHSPHIEKQDEVVRLFTNFVDAH
jgi:pimeloyl-ACP methyl ester carboxylesterase